MEAWTAQKSCETIVLKGSGRPALRTNLDLGSGNYRFNFQFLKGLFKLICYNRKEELGILVLLIATILVNLYVGSLTGGVTGKFYKIIVDKDSDAFGDLVLKSSLLVTGSALLETFIKVILDILVYRWRRNLVCKLQIAYFDNLAFYDLINLDPTIDNPDQRITQDVTLLLAAAPTILRAVIEGPIQIIFYGYLCITSITWYSPLIVVGFWIVAYTINKLLMNPASSATFKQEQLEGNFRFAHTRVRTHSESIALYGGHSQELGIIAASFESVLKNQRRLITWESCITASTNFFAYITSVLNYIIVSIPIFKEWKLPPTSGSAAEYVSLASFRLMMFINGFTQLNNASRTMADFVGYSNRLSQMAETISQISRTKERERASRLEEKETVLISIDPINNTIENNPYQESIQSQSIVEFSNFTAYTPDGRTRLVQNFNLRLQAGQSLLVTGPSGCGKSSLLRCLAGLWTSFDGTISTPSSIMFLPQKPYLPYGSLQQQILYPNFNQESQALLTQDEVWRLLKLVDLEYLVYRLFYINNSTMEERQMIQEYAEDIEESNHVVLDSKDNESIALLPASLKESYDPKSSLVANSLLKVIQDMEQANLNWTDVLSPGEQQRLAMARILFHKPVFAILDESTSCVDEDVEQRFYKLCKQSGITTITVGHRSGLKQYHDLVMSINKRGRWKISSTAPPS